MTAEAARGPDGRRRSDMMLAARRRLMAAVVVAAVVAVVGGLLLAWEVSLLLAWCSGAATFVGLTLQLILCADAERTRTIAMRADESRVASDLIVLVASVASLAGVGLVLHRASAETGAAVAGMTALGAFSVVLAWTVVHTIFTLRYADLYYSPPGAPRSAPGGIEFNQSEPPDYHDFAYLAFTIGMTYQVSDTNLKTRSIRRTALRHALLSYVFGAAIIAVTISAVAGLIR